MCQLDCDDEFNIDNNIKATHIYYIIQESINNSLKHANPKKIIIRIKRIDDKINLEIIDDGVGIKITEKNKEGMGIDIMKYRANIINASFEIVNNETGGTTVCCRINQS